MQRVEDVNRPLKKGELFLVPCIVREEWVEVPYTEEELYMDLGPKRTHQKRIYVTPVINHPHTDRENGQPHSHYHIDHRFFSGIGEKRGSKKDKTTYYFSENTRPQEPLHGTLRYFVLPVVNEAFAGRTNVELIAKSKLKHKCIHKGKCPHRGYDLSQVPEVDGVITCPLHSLRFDARTKKLLNDPTQNKP